MSNSIADTIDNQETDDDTSGYLTTEASSEQLDFDGLFSNRFSNIKLIYSSSRGPTEIYAATRYGRRYILKGLKCQYVNDPIYNLGLVKEFEIGILMDHSNIRRTLSLEVVDGIGKVRVMEYVDGESLESLIASRRMTVDDGRAICRQIADALSYIHRKQIFHRDIKPSNILVAHQDATVKVIDFNLSDSGDYIVLKNPAGSGKYMAPEQMKTDAVPSAAADIYSLGVVMNEIAEVTGDDRLSHLAGKCINPNPKKRPASVSYIVSQLGQPSFVRSLSEIISSGILTYILVTICALLTAFIGWKLLVSY